VQTLSNFLARLEMTLLAGLGSGVFGDRQMIGDQLRLFFLRVLQDGSIYFQACLSSLAEGTIMSPRNFSYAANRFMAAFEFE
jgi:hypothetical protein